MLLMGLMTFQLARKRMTAHIGVDNVDEGTATAQTPSNGGLAGTNTEAGGEHPEEAINGTTAGINDGENADDNKGSNAARADIESDKGTIDDPASDTRKAEGVNEAGDGGSFGSDSEQSTDPESDGENEHPERLTKEEYEELMRTAANVKAELDKRNIEYEKDAKAADVREILQKALKEAGELPDGVETL